MARTIRYLEEELGLIVNQEKNSVGPINKLTNMGFQTLRGDIQFSNRARIRLKDRVRAITRWNNPLSICQLIHAMNKYLRG
jgi:hypothetical protein